MSANNPQAATHAVNKPMLWALAALGLGGFVYAQNHKTPEPHVSFLERPYVSSYLLSSLAQNLREPSSAQFSNTYFVHWDGKLWLCGRVNARNGFGGMTGPQAFIASVREDETGIMLITDAPQCAVSK